MIYLLCFFLAYLLFALTSPLVHRVVIHNAAELSLVGYIIARYVAMLLTGLDSTAVRLMHLKHHRHVDTEDDPHSPQFGRDVKYAYNQMHQLCLTNVNDVSPAGTLLPTTKHLSIYSNFVISAIFYLCVGYLLAGYIGAGLCLAGFVFAHFLFNLHTAITHLKGYQTYTEGCGKSYNLNWAWVLLPGESGMHNNHHAYPRSAKFSILKGEIDFGWPILLVYEKLGLLKINREFIPK